MDSAPLESLSKRSAVVVLNQCLALLATAILTGPVGATAAAAAKNIEVIPVAEWSRGENPKLPLNQVNLIRLTEVYFRSANNSTDKIFQGHVFAKCKTTARSQFAFCRRHTDDPAGFVQVSKGDFAAQNHILLNQAIDKLKLVGVDFDPSKAVGQEAQVLTSKRARYFACQSSIKDGNYGRIWDNCNLTDDGPSSVAARNNSVSEPSSSLISFPQKTNTVVASAVLPDDFVMPACLGRQQKMGDILVESGRTTVSDLISQFETSWGVKFDIVDDHDLGETVNLPIGPNGAPVSEFAYQPANLANFVIGAIGSRNSQPIPGFDGSSRMSYSVQLDRALKQLSEVLSRASQVEPNIANQLPALFTQDTTPLVLHPVKVAAANAYCSETIQSMVERKSQMGAGTVASGQCVNYSSISDIRVFAIARKEIKYCDRNRDVTPIDISLPQTRNSQECPAGKEKAGWADLVIENPRTAAEVTALGNSMLATMFSGTNTGGKLAPEVVSFSCSAGADPGPRASFSQSGALGSANRADTGAAPTTAFTCTLMMRDGCVGDLLHKLVTGIAQQSKAALAQETVKLHIMAQTLNLSSDDGTNWGLNFNNGRFSLGGGTPGPSTSGFLSLLFHSQLGQLLGQFTNQQNNSQITANFVGKVMVNREALLEITNTTNIISSAQVVCTGTPNCVSSAPPNVANETNSMAALVTKTRNGYMIGANLGLHNPALYSTTWINNSGANFNGIYTEVFPDGQPQFLGVLVQDESTKSKSVSFLQSYSRSDSKKISTSVVFAWIDPDKSDLEQNLAKNLKNMQVGGIEKAAPFVDWIVGLPATLSQLKKVDGSTGASAGNSVKSTNGYPYKSQECAVMHQNCDN